MRQRHTLAVLLIVLALLSACGFGGGDPEDEIPGVEPTAAVIAPDAGATAPPAAQANPGEVVTIGFGAQEFERSVFEPLIETFNQQNPNIRVQFVSLDEFMRPVPGAAFDPGAMVRQIVGAADTASVFFIRAEDMKSGLLYDLKPQMDADPDFQTDDFYPGAFGGAGLDSSIYMLPRTLRVQLLSYNKDLWAARGLPVPKSDWTWNDVVAAAEQLAQKRGDTVDVYGLVGWDSGFLALFNEMAARGVDLFGTPSDQVRLDQPEIAAALDRVVALAESGAIYLRPQDSTVAIGGDEFRTLIEEQRAGMWSPEVLFSGPGNDPLKFPVGTALQPQLPLPFFGGTTQGYVMSSGTQHPQEAWRWLSFLSRQSVEQPFQGPDTISELPARKSLAEQSGYWSKLDAETAAAVTAAIERPAQAPVEGAFEVRFFEPLNEALNAVLKGEKKSEAALIDAQANLDKQIAEAQTTPSPTPQRGPVVVATPVAEVAPEGATTIAFGALGFEAEQFRRLAREFNQSGQGIFVQIKNIEPTGQTFGLSTVAEGSDCFAWFNAPQQSEITMTLDLQPLIDADSNFDIAEYPPALLAPFRQDSALYGLPYAVTFRVLTFHKEAFDDAGLSYPTAEWTLDDLLNAAQKLTNDSEQDKRYGYATLGAHTEDLLFFVDRFGGAITQGSGEAQTPNFTDPKVVEALAFYIDLLREYSPHKEIQGYKRNSSFGGDVYQLTSEGQVGMWFDEGNVVFFGGGPSGPQFTRMIAPPPLGTGPLSPQDFRANGLFISAKTEQTQACWQWLKYMSTSPIALGPQGGFPARSSVAESDAFLKQAPSGAAEVYAAYRAALDRTGSNVRESIYLSKIDFFWFFRAVDRALQGKDLERELTDAQTLTEQYLACAQDDAQAATCAQQVDSTYEGWRMAEP